MCAICQSSVITCLFLRCFHFVACNTQHTTQYISIPTSKRNIAYIYIYIWYMRDVLVCVCVCMIMFCSIYVCCQTRREMQFVPSGLIYWCVCVPVTVFRCLVTTHSDWWRRSVRVDAIHQWFCAWCPPFQANMRVPLWLCAPLMAKYRSGIRGWMT